MLSQQTLERLTLETSATELDSPRYTLSPRALPWHAVVGPESSSALPQGRPSCLLVRRVLPHASVEIRTRREERGNERVNRVDMRDEDGFTIFVAVLRTYGRMVVMEKALNMSYRGC